ncbi:MAG: Flp family type IVb pilin [Kineosporiaceae bacterium]|nr:Flp family type IVb pilin [Kineosporiaceae bacterium]
MPARLRSRTEDDGASAVEYGLLVAAIAAVVIGVVIGLSSIARTAVG